MLKRAPNWKPQSKSLGKTRKLLNQKPQDMSQIGLTTGKMSKYTRDVNLLTAMGEELIKAFDITVPNKKILYCDILLRNINL